MKPHVGGDSAARQLFDQLGYWLGIGLASLANVFDPQLIILGGGLVTTGDLLLGPARESFERFIFARAHRELPPLVPDRRNGCRPDRRRTARPPPAPDLSTCGQEGTPSREGQRGHQPAAEAEPTAARDPDETQNLGDLAGV